MLIMRDGYMDMMFMHLSMDMYERISNANIFNIDTTISLTLNDN